MSGRTETEHECREMGPTCRGCPDCKGIVFCEETDAWARECLDDIDAEKRG